MDLLAYGSSQVDIYGGSIDRYLMPMDSSVITIHGSGFAYDGEPFNGELISINGGDWFGEPVRHLTGTLASGEPIDNDFYICYDAKIILVPTVVDATLELVPDTITTKTKWINCNLRLPDHDIADVDLDSIRLEEDISAERASVREKQQILIVKFSASELNLAPRPEPYPLTLSGALIGGWTTFECSDEITVRQKGGKKN